MVFRKLISDCEGGIITTELVLVASFVTATLMAGLSSLKTHVKSEFSNLSNSIQTVSTANQLPAAPAQPKPNSIQPGYPMGTEFAGNIDAWINE